MMLDNFWESVKLADHKILTLKRRRERMILDFQKKCKHAHLNLREASPRHSVFLSTLAPFRVCVACGLAEEGWGCGYFKLKSTEKRGVAQLTREEARKYAVLGVKSQNDLAEERRLARESSKKSKS